MQGQNAALREEVMDLRLRLEGTSSAADEVVQLRQREQHLQKELQNAQETLSHRQVGFLCSCWGMRVGDLLPSTLRSRFRV